MSAPDPAGTSHTPLLVVIDPAARHVDGESVRIARDVLCAGAEGAKVCLPDGPEETEKALARRGSRRPVVVGDDRALLRAVTLLHRERDLGGAELAVVPVGNASSVALARGLGVPPDAVSAARTVLSGVGHRLDLLIDDSGGVVLGGLRIPEMAESGDGGDGTGPGAADGGTHPSDAAARCLEASRWARESLARPLRAVRGLRGAGSPLLPGQRLRVEADGELLADLDRPVREVSVAPDEERPGLAEVRVRPVACEAERDGDGSSLVRARARAVTVSGPDFRYRADAVVGGPVRVRTWTVLAGAWTLTLPV